MELTGSSGMAITTTSLFSSNLLSPCLSVYLADLFFLAEKSTNLYPVTPSAFLTIYAASNTSDVILNWLSFSPELIILPVL
jgi:hypothetical protein